MPFIKVEDVREQLEVSSATAKNIVDDLVRVKILKELTKNKRNRLFAFKPY
jgi:Fic family protein